MKINVFSFFLAATSIIGGIASPNHDLFSATGIEPRAPEACADPSLVVTFVQAFSVANVGYATAVTASFIEGLTQDSNYVDVGKVFQAWPGVQEFTIPLWQLFDSNAGDWILITSNNGTTPSVSGYVSNQNSILGYVYGTQVCGSVPLLGASKDSIGSHWYTTNANDHAELVNSNIGWVDAGIVGYVIPL